MDEFEEIKIGGIYDSTPYNIDKFYVVEKVCDIYIKCVSASSCVLDDGHYMFRITKSNYPIKLFRDKLKFTGKICTETEFVTAHLDITNRKLKK